MFYQGDISVRKKKKKTSRKFSNEGLKSLRNVTLTTWHTFITWSLWSAALFSPPPSPLSPVIIVNQRMLAWHLISFSLCLGLFTDCWYLTSNFAVGKLYYSLKLILPVVGSLGGEDEGRDLEKMETGVRVENVVLKDYIIIPSYLIGL